MTMAAAPASRILRSVGNAARMRRSLVMLPAASSGTLKSTRTSTFLPRRFVRSSSVFLAIPLSKDNYTTVNTKKDKKDQQRTSSKKESDLSFVLYVLFI